MQSFRATDCMYSPGLGPNPGVIIYCPDNVVSESNDNILKIPYATKDFQEWKDALNLKVGNAVSKYFMLLRIVLCNFCCTLP